MPSLGTISGQIRLDVSQAIAAYAAMRAANASTLYALRGGSAAFLAFGKVTAAAGLGLIAVFGKAVSAAAEFERKLDFFGAVSASTAQQMEKVRAKALELGKDTIYSAGQIADSFVELGKAGISAEQIIGGVGEAVANLGAAADIPLDTAAQIITSAVQTFSLSAQDAVHVADLLAGAANASIVEVEDLGVSLKYVGGVAASISIPIESVIDALGLLGKAGIRGSTAGTSLRQILVSLSGTSKKATGVLKDLGIITEDGTNKFFDAEGKAKSLSEIFQILQDHTQGLTEAQRLAAFKTIFNNRALAAASILTREGAEGFAAMNAEISKTTAADVAAKRLDNLSGDLEILRGNIETLLIEAGTPFQEFLRGIVQGLTGLVQSFASLSPEMQKNILWFLAFSGAALTIMGVLSLIVGMIMRFIQTAMLLGSALKVVGTVLKALGIAFKALSVALLTNPVGLIIAGFVLLGVAIWQLWQRSENFRSNVLALWAALKGGWAQVVVAWNASIQWIIGAWEWLKQAFTSGKDWIINAWNSVIAFFQALPGRVSTFISNLVNTITTFLSALPGNIAALLQAGMDRIVAFLQALPERAGYWIGYMVGFILRKLAEMAVTLDNWARNTRDAIIKFFQELPGRVATFFTNMATAIGSKMQQMVADAKAKAAQILAGIVQFLVLLPERARTWFNNMRTRALTVMAQFVQGARTSSSNLIRGVISYIQQLPSRIYSFFNNMRSRALSSLSTLVSNARSRAAALVSAITGAIGRLPGAVSGIFGRVLAAFQSLARRAFNAAKDFAAGLWRGFKAGLGISSPSYIEEAMFSLTDNVMGEIDVLAGQVKMIQGLGNKIVKADPSAKLGADLGRIVRRTTSEADQISAAAIAVADQQAALLKSLAKFDPSQMALSSVLTTGVGAGTMTPPPPPPREEEERDAPLIGEVKVYNPIAEAASQTAARAASKFAQMGGVVK